MKMKYDGDFRETRVLLFCFFLLIRRMRRGCTWRETRDQQDIKKGGTREERHGCVNEAAEKKIIMGYNGIVMVLKTKRARLN